MNVSVCQPTDDGEGTDVFFEIRSIGETTASVFCFISCRGQTESVREVSFIVLLPSSAGADRRNKKGA